MRKPVKTQQQRPRVYCGECKHFLRDTEGINHNVHTGEFFMGVCLRGLHPDTMIKQFANKPRDCEAYRRKEG